MENKKEWVDFKAVKTAVTIEMVLDHYGVTSLKRVGEELRGPCPIHRGTKSSKHLSVNTSKGAFRCFASTCGARGNVLDFVAAMENCSVREAALKLVEWFKIGESTESKKSDSDQATIANLIQSITDLINEIEEHNQQIAFYASAVEEKTARIKEVGERIAKELLLTS